MRKAHGGMPTYTRVLAAARSPVQLLHRRRMDSVDVSSWSLWQSTRSPHSTVCCGRGLEDAGRATSTLTARRSQQQLDRELRHCSTGYESTAAQPSLTGGREGGAGRGCPPPSPSPPAVLLARDLLAASCRATRCGVGGTERPGRREGWPSPTRTLARCKRPRGTRAAQRSSPGLPSHRQLLKPRTRHPPVPRAGGARWRCPSSPCPAWSECRRGSRDRSWGIGGRHPPASPPRARALPRTRGTGRTPPRGW
mmetsp:Transcript_3981/g.11252  ORF Transcript_3981/g.11252 Transcript_3981/m.11252 type:complete len:252 (-) Transcript_3981:224-979(-)